MSRENMTWVRGWSTRAWTWLAAASLLQACLAENSAAEEGTIAESLPEAPLATTEGGAGETTPESCATECRLLEELPLQIPPEEGQCSELPAAAECCAYAMAMEAARLDAERIDTETEALGRTNRARLILLEQQQRFRDTAQRLHDTFRNNNRDRICITRNACLVVVEAVGLFMTAYSAVRCAGQACIRKLVPRTISYIKAHPRVALTGALGTTALACTVSKTGTSERPFDGIPVAGRLAELFGEEGCISGGAQTLELLRLLREEVENYQRQIDVNIWNINHNNLLICQNNFLRWSAVEEYDYQQASLDCCTANMANPGSCCGVTCRRQDEATGWCYDRNNPGNPLILRRNSRRECSPDMNDKPCAERCCPDRSCPAQCADCAPDRCEAPQCFCMI